MNEVEIVVTSQDKTDSGFNSVRQKARSLGSDIAKMLGRSGGDGALDLSAQFSGRIGPLLAKAPVSPPIIAAIAAAAPTISAVVTGAIVGGAALGAVGIGAALASKRAEVQKAGTALKDDIMSALVIDAKPMVAPILSGLDIVRSEFNGLRPQIQGIFADASRYVEPLARALAGFGREVIPGIREAVRSAEPIIDVLEKHGPRAGKAFSDALSLLSKDAGTAAESIDLLMSSLEILVTSSAVGMSVLNTIFKYTAGHLIFLNDKLTEGQEKEAEAAAKAAAEAEKLARAQARMANAAARSVEEIDALNQALSEAPDEALSAEQAILAMERSYKDLGEAIDKSHGKNKKFRDLSLDAREALLDYAGSVQNAASAAKRQSGSQESANAVLDAGRKKFLAAATAAGVNAKEATNLANKLFGIPNKRQTDIHVNKQAAEKAIADVNSSANHAARPRTIWFTVAQAGSLGAIGQRATGGITGAASGGVRGGLTMVGEQGPELVELPFGSKVHPHGTSREMMRQASGGDGGGSLVLEVSAKPGFARDLADAVIQTLAFRIRTNGGDPQALGIA